MSHRKDVLAKGTIQRGKALFKRPEVIFWDNEPRHTEELGWHYLVGLLEEKGNPFKKAKSLRLPKTVDNLPVIYVWTDRVRTAGWGGEYSYPKPESELESVNGPYVTDEDITYLRVYHNPMHAGLEILAESQHRYRIRGATLGCVVWDAVNGRPLLLGNAHVMANGAFYGTTYPAEEVGHPIYQPRYPDLAGNLLRWGTNDDEDDLNVDAAVATVAAGRSVDYTGFGPYGEFPRAAAAAPQIDDEIYIVGRSSGQVSGTITGVAATVTIDGIDFADCVHLSTRISRSGDSGSLMFLVAEPHNPVGLFFAHGVLGTWGIKAQLVEEDLGISFDEVPAASASGGRRGLRLILKVKV